MWVQTVMKNRVGSVIEKLKSDRSMKRGEWDEWVREDDKACIVKWKDNKSVLLLSSCVGSEPESTCKRWSREENKKVDIPQPSVVQLYNNKMGGVDLCDRFLSYYRCYIRTRKWPVRMFNHFVDLVVVNCWIMYRRWIAENNVSQEKPLSLLDFKMHLGKALINFKQIDQTNTGKRGRPRKSTSSYDEETDQTTDRTSKKPRRVIPQPIPEVRFDGVGHMPRFVPAKNASKCRNSSCHGKTRIVCVKCQMYLCVMNNNCFEKYHTKNTEK